MSAIRIDGLVVAYGGQRVIDGLSLAIDRGTMFTLLGPSGCGKTTLLRAIAGFVPAEAGAIAFGARDVTRVPAHLRNIGMVFQDYALFPDKTVFDNVAYGLRARRQDEAAIARRVAAALERVGLGALGARHPAALSGGQRQRVALARALVIEPDVLLMDEPLSNLDAKLRVQVRETIATLQREAGITTVFVTHDQEEALAISDRIGVMRGGRLEQVGPPEAIYREPASAYVADFVGAANILEAESAAHDDLARTVALALEGATIGARALAPLAAGKAVLVARPEDIAILAADAAAPASLPARVVRRQYLGDKTSYAVELASGRVVAVDRHGPGHDRFRRGDQVRLAFDPRLTLALRA